MIHKRRVYVTADQDYLKQISFLKNHKYTKKIKVHLHPGTSGANLYIYIGRPNLL